MAVIKTYISGGCTIVIHDDYMPKTKEENDVAMERFAEVVRRQAMDRLHHEAMERLANL